MNRLHLLWWVFDYLYTCNRDVLDQMERNLTGDDKHPWVNKAFRERLDAWRKSNNIQPQKGDEHGNGNN